jgi:hypothetical protein
VPSDRGKVEAWLSEVEAIYREEPYTELSLGGVTLLDGEGGGRLRVLVRMVHEALGMTYEWDAQDLHESARRLARRLAEALEAKPRP